MKREIKFRGKRLDNETWEYGSLVILNGRYFIFNDECRVEVVPSTVGQYTGQTDRNGKEVYERDIVRFIEADGEVINDEVMFWEGGFTPVVQICWMADIEEVFMEVIGNIHDNPELLETE